MPGLVPACLETPRGDWGLPFDWEGSSTLKLTRRAQCGCQDDGGFKHLACGAWRAGEFVILSMPSGHIKHVGAKTRRERLWMRGTTTALSHV